MEAPVEPAEMPESMRDLETAGFSVSLEHVDPLGTYPTHQHGEAHIEIVDGSMIVKLNGEDITVFAGDKLTIPAQTPHGAIVGKNGCSYWQAEDKTGKTD